MYTLFLKYGFRVTTNTSWHIVGLFTIHWGRILYSFLEAGPEFLIWETQSEMLTMFGEQTDKEKIIFNIYGQ